MEAAAVDPIELLFSYGDEKVEWAGGRVVEHSYESFDENRLKGFLSTILGLFAEQRAPGRVFGSRFLQRLDASTVRAPDISYLKQSGFDRIRPTHLEGGADLVIEITVSKSRRRDRGEKFYEYEAAGIGEYWLVDVERRRAEFHRLSAGL